MGELDPVRSTQSFRKTSNLDCGYILVNAAECEPDWNTTQDRIEEQDG